MIYILYLERLGRPLVFAYNPQALQCLSPSTLLQQVDSLVPQLAQIFG
jgi:hypothetical protein